MKLPEFDFEKFAINRYPHPEDLSYLKVLHIADHYGLDLRPYDTAASGHILAAVLREAWSRWPSDKGNAMNWAMGIFYEDNVKLLTRCVELLGSLGERLSWEELGERQLKEAVEEIKRVLGEMEGE